jgi:hypothetical protein
MGLRPEDFMRPLIRLSVIGIAILATAGWGNRSGAQTTRSGNKLSSEVINNVVHTEVASDFVSPIGPPVNMVTVYGGPWGGNWTPTSFNIRFYDDGGCVPVSLIYEHLGETGSSTFDHTDPGDTFSIYKIEIPVNFAAAAGSLFWVSVQAANHPGPEQWGIELTNVVQSCEDVFKGAYFGFPNWVPQSAVPEIRDARIEVSYGEPVAVQSTTWGRVRGLFR